MKKPGLIFVLFAFLSVNVFAQNGAYTELLKKAQSYEAKTEWVYAMGYYVDAICADPENSNEAQDALYALADEIKTGNPGHKTDGGKFSVFEMYENWKNLLMNAEKYWTEFFPYEIVIHPLEMGTPDYATKTAEYKAKIQLLDSSKFEFIMTAIMDGYSAAYKSDWVDMPSAKKYSDTRYSSWSNLDYRVDRRSVPAGYYYAEEYRWWPLVSVTKVPNAKKVAWSSKINSSNSGTDYPIVKDKAQLYRNGVAVYAYPSAGSRNSEKDSKTGKYSFKDYGVSEYYNPWFLTTNSGYTYANCFMYDLKVKIVDEKGNVIAPVKRYMPAEYSPDAWYKDYAMDYVSFTGITQSQMGLIDSGKAWVEVEAVLLQYGFQQNDDLNAFAYRNSASRYSVTSNDPLYFKKNLPEISIDMEKVAVKNIVHPGQDRHDFKDIVNEKEINQFISRYGRGEGVLEYNLEDSVVYVLKTKFIDSTTWDDYSLDSGSSYFKNISDKFGKHLTNFGTNVYGWEFANTMSSLYGLPNYYTDSDKTTGNDDGFHFISYDEYDKYEDILDGRYYVLLGKRVISEEEKATRLEKVKAQGFAVLDGKEEKIESYGSIFENDEYGKTIESAKASVTALKSALEGDSVVEISSAAAEVKKIDFAGLDSRLAYINELMASVDVIKSKASERYEKAVPFLGEDNWNLRKLKDYMNSLDNAIASGSTARIRDSYENLCYWYDENTGAVQSGIDEATRIQKGIDEYYSKNNELVDSYIAVLGATYGDSRLKQKKNALKTIKEGIDANDIPKIVSGYKECEWYGVVPYGNMEADYTAALENARVAVSYYDEMTAHCAELRSVLDKVTDSNLTKMEENLAKLKDALDKEDVLSINKYYKACKDIRLSSAENKYDTILKDAAVKAKKEADYIRNQLNECDTYLQSVKKNITENSKYSETLKSLEDEYAKLRDAIAGKSDGEVVGYFDSVGALQNDFWRLKLDVRSETFEYVLASVGLTLIEQKGTIPLWYDSSSHNYSTEQVYVYAVKMDKKSAVSKQTGIKTSDYLIFPVDTTVLKGYKLKDGTSYTPMTYGQFIDSVVAAKDGGPIKILYVRKSLGSYDGYVETVNVVKK